MGDDTQDLTQNIDLEEGQKTEPQEGAKPADSPPADQTEPIQDGAPAKPQESEPWHKSERFTKITDRMRRAEERAEALQEKYEQLLENQARMNSLTQRSDQSQTLTPEAEQAAVHLADVLSKNPRTAEILGLNQVKALQDELKASKEARENQAYDLELDKNLDSYSNRFKLDRRELEQEFHEFTQDKDLPFRKGVIDLVFKAMFSDRQGELKEREVNSKLIDEKKQKTTQGTEAPSKGRESRSKNLPKRMEDHIDNLIREGGGEIAFD